MGVEVTIRQHGHMLLHILGEQVTAFMVADRCGFWFAFTCRRGVDLGL
jgi:hypothetical protein